MQNIAKLVKGASPLVALLFVIMTSFNGGLLITMANGSASSLFSCEVIKGTGNTTLTNASLLQGAGKVSLGLNCSGTKSQTQTVTSVAVSRNSVKRSGVKRSGVKRNSVKRNSVKRNSVKRNSVKRNSVKRNSSASPSPLFSCDVVKGRANTKLTISPPLQGALRPVHLGLNCKTAGVLIPSHTTPKTKNLAIMNGFDTTLDDREVTQDCQVGQDGCVAITCFSGDNQVPCVNHEGITVTSCYWENAQAVDGQNGCLDHQI